MKVQKFDFVCKECGKIQPGKDVGNWQTFNPRCECGGKVGIAESKQRRVFRIMCVYCKAAVKSDSGLYPFIHLNGKATCRDEMGILHIAEPEVIS